MTISPTVLALVRECAPPWARNLVEHAFAGDAEAAADLGLVLPKAHRAMVAELAILNSVAPAACRELLLATFAQSKGHGKALKRAGTRKRFVAWCQYCQFPLPDLPPEVTVFCGAHSKKPANSARKLSWTLDFDCAAYFAVGPAHRPPAALGLVLEASVPASQICFYDNRRHEAEVMLEWAPRQYRVHEKQSVLAEAAERYRTRTSNAS